MCLDGFGGVNCGEVVDYEEEDVEIGEDGDDFGGNVVDEGFRHVSTARIAGLFGESPFYEKLTCYDLKEKFGGLFREFEDLCVLKLAKKTQKLTLVQIETQLNLQNPSRRRIKMFANQHSPHNCFYERNYAHLLLAESEKSPNATIYFRYLLKKCILQINNLSTL